MDASLICALIVWTALCVPFAQEIWRSIRWPRCRALVTGHTVYPHYRDDGTIEVTFHVPGRPEPIYTSIPHNDSKFPYPSCWPIGTEIELAYRPRSPELVTWPIGVGKAIVVGLFMIGGFCVFLRLATGAPVAP